MRIAVLGAGNIGGTLGRKWLAAGHEVAFGVAHPDGEKAQALRAELGDRARIGTAGEALAGAEVAVMALPGGAMADAIRDYASALDGTIVLDTANNLGGGPANSLAAFQAHTPHARVYRAFNTLGWETFAEPTFDGVRADLFYCGPNGEAQAVVERLISDVGLRPVRVGDTDETAVVDAIATLWFALALRQRHGRHLAFKLLSDEAYDRLS
jgi:predicted dinucleotide-binding enzyme